MLIYAKRSFRASPRRLAHDIRGRIAGCSRPSLELAREWLVATGQLEQSILDAGEAGGPHATAVTFAAADLFLAILREQRVSSTVLGNLDRLISALELLEKSCSDRELEIRVPEGFAWYALYPDSYAQAAESWARRLGSEWGKVNVIGLRSIGTTLAAVVSQALRNCGLTVAQCFTVRTSGPPFSRQVELPPDFKPATHNIVVDEGPGLSGSSMVAVARALESAGAKRDRIYFFAGHRNGPGPEADEEVRRWWSSSRVWTTELDETLVGSYPFPEVLSRGVEKLAGERAMGPAEPFSFEDWRALANLDQLPRAIAPNLETPKKIVRLRSSRAVLLKFFGFALTSADCRPSVHVKTCSEAVPTYGSIHRWIAMPWIEGARLTVQDGSTEFIRNHLAPWIAKSAIEEIETEEVLSGCQRIEAALKIWAIERGFELPQFDWTKIGRECSTPTSSPQLCYGDGRLAPHEWIRTPGGSIRKIDSWPHHFDHTWVGRQPIAWDLSGAEVEWELGASRAEILRRCVEEISGYSCRPATLAFYEAGYCVFRAAVAHLNAITGRDEHVREHLKSASKWYEKRLQAALTKLAKVAEK